MSEPVSILAALIEGDRWLSADGCAAYLGLFRPNGEPNRKGFMDRICRQPDFPSPLTLGRSKRWKASLVQAWHKRNPDLSKYSREILESERNRPSRHRRADEPTCLYRHFDHAGVLLYVGISLTAAERLSRHHLESPWFRDVANITLEWHPCRDSALKAERRAIRTERPRFNKHGAQMSEGSA